MEQEVINKENPTGIRKCEYVDYHMEGERSSQAWCLMHAHKFRNNLNTIADIEWIKYFKNLFGRENDKIYAGITKITEK